MILKHFDINNLHHAYLIEGAREEIMLDVFLFMKKLGVATSNNPDFYNIFVDSFKIEDAHNLKSIQYEKGFTTGKKIFVISANNFLLNAQNALLKIFEEPIENTHFFIITPDTDILLKTLVSRFYLIKTKASLENELKEAEKFISMPIKNRIDFIKELLIEEEDSEALPLEGGKASELDSVRSKSLKFLNALEVVLHSKKNHLINSSNDFFYQIFKVREFLNQPGSSIKSLMESIALITPNF